MKMLVFVYLLTKSFFNKKFTWFDIDLANALKNLYAVRFMDRGELLVVAPPSWIEMIANMKMEAKLPEAFMDFMYELKHRKEA